jgi:hypothetical protein
MLNAVEVVLEQQPMVAVPVVLAVMVAQAMPTQLLELP